MENILSVFADKANLIGASVVAGLTYVFGVYWQVFAFFLLLNVVDFYYGRAKGKETGTLSSKKGAKGIFKKLSYWVMIGIAFAVGEVLVDLGTILGVNLGFVRLIGWLTLAVYILNELTSIVENMIVLGYDVPEILVRGLAVARSTVNAAGDKVIPDTKENQE